MVDIKNLPFQWVKWWQRILAFVSRFWDNSICPWPQNLIDHLAIGGSIRTLTWQSGKSCPRMSRNAGSPRAGWFIKEKSYDNGWFTGVPPFQETSDFDQLLTKMLVACLESMLHLCFFGYWWLYRGHVAEELHSSSRKKLVILRWLWACSSHLSKLGSGPCLLPWRNSPSYLEPQIFRCSAVILILEIGKVSR